MSDVWHACGNCGGRFPCEASDAREASIASLRAVVRVYLAAESERLAASSYARELDAVERVNRARRELYAIVGEAS